MKPFSQIASISALGLLFIGCAGTPQLTELQQANLAAGSDVRVIAGPDGQMNFVDFNNDGVADGKLIDSDADNIFDGIDTNNDNQIDEPLSDTNGDGILDGIDSNNDGVPDSTIVYPPAAPVSDPSVQNSEEEDDSVDAHVVEPDSIQSCNGNSRKVLVCKVPPGNPSNEHTICVGAPAVKAHLNKGSYLGRCKTDDTDGEEDNQ